jgi:hypothetical protein
MNSRKCFQNITTENKDATTDETRRQPYFRAIRDRFNIPASECGEKPILP